jgi:hypothetical protein
MEIAVLVVVSLLVRLVKASRVRAPKAQSVCLGCAFAHVQYGADGRISISCTYAGGLRAMKMNVAYCTEFRNRHQLVQIAPVGFIAGI